MSIALWCRRDAAPVSLTMIVAQTDRHRELYRHSVALTPNARERVDPRGLGW
jgi:hypothetical protein